MDSGGKVNGVRGPDAWIASVFSDKTLGYGGYWAVHIHWDNVFSAEKLSYQAFRIFVGFPFKICCLYYRHLRN